MELKKLDRSEYAGDYDSAVLAQWKSCVDAANAVSDKRNTSNSVYITLNTALLALISFSMDYKSFILAAIGVTVCLLWMITIRNYRKLSAVKFEIIDLIERDLPLAPYEYEWKKLSGEKKYVTLSKIEGVLPWIFIFLYLLSVVWPIIKSLLV